MGGANTPPTPAKAPPAADTFGAQLAAMRYAETQRRLRESRGRRSMFLTTDSANQPGQTYGRPPGSVDMMGK